MSISATTGLNPFAGFDQAAPAPADAETFGAQVVTKTLDTMNKAPSGGTNADYDFQKSVLGAAYTGAGTILDTEG